MAGNALRIYSETRLLREALSQNALAPYDSAHRGHKLPYFLPLSPRIPPRSGVRRVSSVLSSSLREAGVGSTENFDLLVIGCGPAGEKAGAQAAYFGKRVAMIERARHVAHIIHEN